MKQKCKQGGFTLIELLVYLVIVGIMLVSLINYAWNVIEGGIKSSTQQEVYSQARYVSERIKLEIRNAADINSVSATQISLKEADLSKDPTVINLASGKINLKQGAASAIALNSNDTQVSVLNFSDYTSADKKTKHIGFSFTIADSLPIVRQEYQESISLESSAELRSN